MIETTGTFILRLYDDGHGELIMQYEDGSETMQVVPAGEMDNVRAFGNRYTVAIMD